MVAAAYTYVVFVVAAVIKTGEESTKYFYLNLFKNFDTFIFSYVRVTAVVCRQKQSISTNYLIC